MANRYWVGGTASWNGTAGSKWATTSGGSGGAAEPTASDDVFFDGASGAVTVTVATTTALCNNIDFTGFTGTFAGSTAMTVSGNLTLGSGMTRTYTGTITFNATSTGKTITSNGVALNSALTFNGVGGGWVVQDALDTGKDLTLTNGSFDANNQNITIFGFLSSNSNVRTLSMGSGLWTLTSNNTPWTTSTSTNLTYNPSTSTITANSSTSASRAFTTGSIRLNSLTITAGTGTISLSGNFTDVDLTGFSGALAATNLDISGSYTGTATMTYAGGGGGSVNFSATTTGKTISAYGVSWGQPITFNGVGGGWTLQTALSNVSSAITLTAGTLDTNGQSVTTASSFLITGSTTRTLTCGASAISVNAWNATTTTNLTFNPDTSTITMTGSQTFAGGGLTYNNVVFTAANPLLTGANTFANLTHTGAAAKTCTLSLGADQVVTSTFTFNGNSVTNRLLAFSSVVGTARTITAATVTVSNADFQDITGAGAASWNLSAITGNSGDCGGNSGITFTTPATQTWSGTSGGNWSANAWGGRVPLPQDDVVINAAFSASQTVTADMPRLGKSIDFTGATGTPHLDSNTTASIFGSLTLISGMTVGNTAQLTFRGRGSYTLTNAGNTWIKSFGIEAPGGSITLQDNFTANVLSLSAGTFDANNNNVTIARMNSTGSITRELIMGNGVWTLNDNASTIWSSSGSNITVTPGTQDVICNYSGGIGTRTVTLGTHTESSTPSFAVTAGSDIIAITGRLYSLDFTGFTGSWSSGTMTVYGSLIISSGMTVTDGANIVTFSSTSGTKTITTNGVTFSRPITFDGVGGTWALQDALVGGAARRVIITNGTLNLNNQNVTIGLLTASTGTTLTMGSGTIELTGTGSTVTNINGSATINCGTSTIKVTDSSTAANTLSLGTKTYHNLWFARGASTGSNTISGSNTFNEIKDTGSAAHSMIFTNSTTTSLVSFTVSGSSGNLITINSSGTAVHTLVKLGGGIVSCDYLNIQHSVATPGAWYAGLNSVNNQATATAGSGWIFDVPPIPNEQRIALQAVTRASRY